jgi:transposase
MYEKSQQEVVVLKQQLSELRRLIFGSKSERFIANDSQENQLGLFEENLPQEAVSEKEQINYSRNKPKEKQVPVRALLPAHLPRVEEIIEPESLDAEAVKIGEQVTEILEYNPAKVFVRKIVRPKYVLKKQNRIVIAELPILPLPKSNAGASLLAHILVSKYVDHLPFYRQRQIFKRQDLKLSDSTLSGWFNAATRLLEPLYDCLQNKLLQSKYLQADESPIGVQDSHKSGSLHTGYHWVYHAPEQGLVLFKYDKSRSQKAPQKFLEDFSGTLQTDGYKVYQNLQLKGELKRLSCMAHARRYFEKALDNDKTRASHVLEQIQVLYALERKIKERKTDAQLTQRYRRRYAKPILKQLHLWMQEQYTQVLPKSSIAKAIAYSLRLWTQLSDYTENGNYQIDNNPIENTIRPLALGRKNYLFAGSHKAAQKAAMMYSFFATCKINQVEPYAWLNDILQRIPEHKANKLDQLLPQNWNKRTMP